MRLGCLAYRSLWRRQREHRLRMSLRRDPNLRYPQVADQQVQDVEPDETEEQIGKDGGSSRPEVVPDPLDEALDVHPRRRF